MGKGFASKIILCIIISVLFSTACSQQPGTTSKPVTTTAYSLRTTNVPVLNTAKYRDLATKLQPDVRTWVIGEALKICDLNAGENMLIEDIQNHFRGQRLNQDAINTVQALVWIQAIDNLDKEISTLTEKREEVGNLTGERERKLQTAMERYSKCVSNLLDTMKKTSNTDDTIILKLRE